MPVHDGISGCAPLGFIDCSLGFGLLVDGAHYIAHLGECHADAPWLSTCARVVSRLLRALVDNDKQWFVGQMNAISI